MTAILFPTPPRIPVRGANDHDIEASCRYVELGSNLFMTAIMELITLYRGAVLSAIENHNENISHGSKVRAAGFTCGLQDALDDLRRSMDALTSDVCAEMRQALED
jgi:hypothetical protein